tara:strand:+ start:240 stop:1073 length:834 start_codon:yes stop_codon:yes gene_type:complete
MSDFIKAGVIGHPIKHSKSPLIHNHWIEQYGLSGRYEAIDIHPDQLAVRLKDLIENEDYKGFNLTIPHKELVLDICDEITSQASAIGAVNTITVKEGKILGSNTDGFGFAENIKLNAPNFDFTKGTSVILGAGGAARACIAALIEEGAPRILLLNRTREKAEKLKKDLSALDVIEIIDWEERHAALEAINLLVNTTALGMESQRELELDLSALPQNALVNDIVYAPLYTKLLREAQAQGNDVVTGIGMLLHQARPAFKQWFGVMPQVDKKLEEMVLA